MNTENTCQIAELYRYPVKGLSPEPLRDTMIRPGECIAFDRAFAIENGRGGFDAADPRHLPKNKFLMLMSNERLATLTSEFDDETRMLTIKRDGKQVARGCLDQRIGRQLIEQFLSAYMSEEIRGAPKIVTAPGHNFTDVEPKWLSVINLASIRDLERVEQKKVHPLRFRGNIYVDGLEPWQEFDWVGRTLAVNGKAALRCEERITRCAAINVDPDSGARDLALTRTLMAAFGHMDMGLYASVAEDCRLGRGDTITLTD